MLVAFEFAQQETLQSCFASSSTLGKHVIFGYLQDMLRGLQYCHSRGIVHTDLRRFVLA